MYCKIFNDLTGIKRFCVKDNNIDLIASITKINDKNEAKYVSTYDFSTLYSMQHEKLELPLKSIIVKTFAATENNS